MSSDMTYIRHLIPGRLIMVKQPGHEINVSLRKASYLREAYAKMYYVDAQTKFRQRTLIFFKKAEISALTPVLIHILMIPYVAYGIIKMCIRTGDASQSWTKKCVYLYAP